MKPLSRRRALLRMGTYAAVAGAAASARTPLQAQEAASGRVIEIEARRFAYTPAEISATQGETITLALKAIDFMHGFSIPDLKVRTDLVPGRVVSLRLQLDRAGRYAFLCDNFCGDGHEEMNGTLIVQAQ